MLDVGILIFDDVELLDFAGPLEVFYAARLSEKQKEQPLFNPFTIAKSKEPIKVKGGLKVIPDKTFQEIENLDLLIIPGGKGAREMKGDEPEVKFIRKMETKVEQVATVCTGSYLYCLAGDRKGLELLTHHSRIDEFKTKFPKVKWIEGYRYYEDDVVVTAAGISCGIDLALYLVYKFFGEEAADYTAQYLEYHFTP